MSTEVENRVAKLTFDGDEFEKDVSQTLKVLDELDKSLQFEGASKGFNELERAAGKVDLTGIQNSVEELASKFTLLGNVQQRVFREISERIMGLERKFENMIKSLTIDQVTAGWDKYAEKTSSVQTIMGAVSNEIEDAGERMKYVNEQLKMLNWFTDETSYNFLDMVSNIGKFTSNQVPLQQAVVSMQGIATWAAKSGANVQEASRAMYNLSQAISMGALKMMDWKSIENANMATAEFKKTAIETAEQMGVLTKAGEGVWKTVKGTTVTIKQFRDTLSEGWLNSNVLLETLNKYGEFSVKLHDSVQKTSVMTSDLLDAIDKYKEGVRDFDDYVKEGQMAEEDFEKVVAELADDNYEFGRSAFKAAQEAKTFAEAVNSVKDAVSTGWMSTFEIIFGDYEEAKRLWTGFAEWAWDVFNGGAQRRNDIAQAWKAFGGRLAVFGDEDTVGIFQAILGTIRSFTGPISEAWHELFPVKTATEMGRKLAEISIRLRNLFENMKLSTEASEGLKRVMHPLVVLCHYIATALEVAGKSAVILIYGLGYAVNAVLEFIGTLDLSQDSFLDFIKNSKAASIVLGILGTAASIPAIVIGSLVLAIQKLIEWCRESPTVNLLATALKNVSNAIGGQAAKYISKAGEAFSNLYQRLKPLLPTMTDLQNGLSKVGEFLKGIPAVLAKALDTLAEFIRSENKLERIKNLFVGLVPTFQKLGVNIIKGLGTGIIAGFTTIAQIGANLFEIFRVAFANAAGIHSPSVVMQAFGGMIIMGLVAGLVGLYSYLKSTGYDVFATLFSGMKTAQQTEQENLTTPYEPLVDQIESDGQEVVKQVDATNEEITTTFSDGWEKIKKVFTPIAEFFKRFLDNLNAGHVIIIAFSIATISMMRHLNRVTDSVANMITTVGKAIGTLITAMAGPFNALKNGMDITFKSLSAGITRVTQSIAARNMADNFLKNAIAIGIFTLAFISLYEVFKQVDVNALKGAGIAVAAFAGTLLLLTTATYFMGKALSAGGGFEKAAIAMGTFAVLLGATASAIAIMSNIISKNPSAVVAGGIVLAGEMYVFAKTCAYLGEHVKTGLKGALGFLSIALTFNLIAKALTTVANSFESIEQMGTSALALAAVATVMGNVMKILDGVEPGAGLSFISVMASMFLAFKLMVQIHNYVQNVDLINPWETLKKSLSLIIELAGIMLVASRAVRIAGTSLQAAGFGLAAGFGALYIAFGIFNKIHNEWDMEAFKGFFEEVFPAISEVAKTVLIISAVIELLRGLKLKMDAVGVDFQLGKGGGIFRGFLGFGLGLAAIVGSLKLMEYLDVEKIGANLAALSTLMVVFGVAVGIAGLGKNVASNIQKMTIAIIAMTVCIGFLTLFVNEGDYGKVIAPAIALMLGLIGFGVTLAGAAKIANYTDIKPFIAMMVAAAGLATAMYFLAKYDWKALLSASMGLSACLLSITGMATLMANLKPPKFGAWLSAIGMMVAAGAVLVGLTMFNWQGMIEAGAALGIVMLSLSTALLIASQSGPSMTTGAKALLNASLALVPAALSLAIVALNPWDNIAQAGLALGAAVLAVSGALFVASKSGASMETGATALLSASIALIPAAAALWIVSQNPWDGMIAAAGALAICVGALSLGLLPLAKTGPEVAAGGAALLVASFALLPASAALSSLAGYDWKSIITATGALLVTLGIVAAITNILGGIAVTGIGAISLAAGAAAIAIFGLALEAFVSPCIKFVDVVDRLGPAIDNLTKSISDLTAFNLEAVQNASTSIESISSALVLATGQMATEVSAAMYSVGEFAGLSLVAGMADSQKLVYAGGVELGHEGVEEGVRDGTGVHSLSDIFIGIAKWIGASLVSGMDSSKDGVYEAGEELGDAGVQGAQSESNLDAAYNAGSSLGNSIWDGLKNFWNNTIKPWIDQIGSEDTSGVFGKDGVVGNMVNGMTNAMNSDTANNIKGWFKEALEDPMGKINSIFETITGGKFDLNGMFNSEEWQKQIEEATKGYSDLGAAAGGAGSGMKSATDAAEEFPLVTDYATTAIRYFKEQYDSQAESLMDISSWERAIGATEEFVLSYGKLSGALGAEFEGIESFGDMNAEQAQKVRDAWVNAFDGIRANLSGGFGDVFSMPTFGNAEAQLDPLTSFEQMKANLENQEKQMIYFQNTLVKLYQEGLEQDLLDELLQGGPENLSKIMSWDELTAEEIQEINKSYRRIQDTMDNLTMELIETQAQTWSGAPAEIANIIYDKVSSEDYTRIQNQVEKQTSELLDRVLSTETNWEEFQGTRLGELLNEGIASGVESMTDIAVSAVEQLGKEMMDAMLKSVQQTAQQSESMLKTWNKHIQSQTANGTIGYGWDPKSGNYSKEIGDAQASFNSQAKTLLGALSYYTGGDNYDPDTLATIKEYGSKSAVESAIRALSEDRDNYFTSGSYNSTDLAGRLDAAVANSTSKYVASGGSEYTSSVKGSMAGGYGSVTNVNVSQYFESTKDEGLDAYCGVESAAASVVSARKN